MQSTLHFQYSLSLWQEHIDDAYGLAHRTTAITSEVEDESLGSLLLQVDESTAHILGTIIGERIEVDITDTTFHHSVIWQERHLDSTASYLYLQNLTSTWSLYLQHKGRTRFSTKMIAYIAHFLIGHILVIDAEDDVALLCLALNNNNKFAREESHVWLSEGIERSSITIACCLEASGTLYLEGKFIIGERTLIAVLIQKTHGDESKVVAIGIQQHIVLIGAAFYHTGDRLMVWSLNAELHLRRFAGCTLHVLAYLVAILIVGNHANLARLILHIVPAEAIAVEAA